MAKSISFDIVPWLVIEYLFCILPYFTFAFFNVP